MNLLFLTPQLPYPPQQGASLRNYYIIKGAAQNHQVTLLSFREAGQQDDPETIAPLLALCRQVKTVAAPEHGLARRLRRLLISSLPDMGWRLYSPVFEEALRRLLQEHSFDVAQIEGIELARYITIIRQVSPQSRILFDDHNAETELQRRAYLTDLSDPRRWPAAAYSWLQTQRLRRFERWACRQADWVTAVSEADRRHLQRLAPGRPIHAIPNCLDVRQYETPVPAAEQLPFDLVFSGKMDYRPNVDAVLWFAREIWPRIRQARPETTWAIVGQKPHARLSPLGAMPGVTLTGWTPEVRPYLAGAKVYIMPFRLGSGTRLKLIEAMAEGKAIVSTRSGAEGYEVRHERELLLADSAAAFSAAALHLLDRPAQRLELGRRARAFAARYDWRLVIPQFERLYTARSVVED